MAGDLQAQATELREGNEHDAWLAGYMMERGLASVGDGEATYMAGEDGARSAIDHWLVEAPMWERASAMVGAGADGLCTTDGEGAEAAPGQGRAAGETAMGHNSLQLLLHIGTRAAEAAEEELEQRETQLRPMDKLEWEAYEREEEDVIRAAEEGVQAAGFGAAALRLTTARPWAIIMSMVTPTVDAMP